MNKIYYKLLYFAKVAVVSCAAGIAGLE